MTTINQVCKQIVTDAIDHDYVAEYDNNLGNVYRDEYGYNGASPRACRDYLQGLPSVCTIPFYNGEILELLAKHGIVRKSEAAKEKLIDNYWLACGNAFYNMIK